MRLQGNAVGGARGNGRMTVGPVHTRKRGGGGKEEDRLQWEARLGAPRKFLETSGLAINVRN